MKNLDDSADNTRPAGRRRLLMAGLPIAVALGLAVALWNGDTPTPARLGQMVRSGDAAGFNVLLVTLDTLRRDRLGCYGYKSARTPTIDSLAQQGVQFDDAVTSVPITLPSHATILTGLYPPNHGVRDNGKYQLGAEYVTLAETLKAHGYDTAAFVACFVLDERFGLAQGFDVYDLQVTADGIHPLQADFNERPASAVTDAAIAWLNERQESGATAPFFLWVHYFDPHRPFKSPLQKTHPQLASRPYDAEIAFVDAELGRLLDHDAWQELGPRTLVAIVADHGESLGEHQERSHGMFLYEATMRVPFILSCPGLFDRPHRVDDRVIGLVDLRPTLEDLLGITPTAPCDGQSLLQADRDAGRAIYIETQYPLSRAWSPLYGLRYHTGKYILAPDPEYYDLQEDPSEARNAFDSSPPRLASAERELSRLMNSWQSPGGAARTMDDDELERLSALGYVHVAAATPAGPLPDPKDMMPVYRDGRRAWRLYNQGEYQAAATLAREVLAQSETSLEGLSALAFSYAKLGRTSEAVELLRDAVKRNPDSYLLRSLVWLLRDRRQYDAVEEVLKLYETIDPRDGRVPLLRGDCLADQHRHRDAIAQYEEAIRLDENRAGFPARERIARLKETLGEQEPAPDQQPQDGT